MANWKDLLKTATIEQCLERARSGRDTRIKYVLGKGGFDPAKPLTDQCDCSGFIAWSIGIPREFPPLSNRWMDTDAYWSGGGSAANAAGFPLLHTVAPAESEAGDLIVYPDRNGKQGHIGIISGTDENGQLKIIHCSKGNWNNFGDATRETGPNVWDIQSKTRIMRLDFDALRRYAGIGNGAGAPVVDPDTAPAETSLRHSLLANDSALRLVAAGTLTLARTGNLVSGIASVQQAMNILAHDHGEYAIDLGPNEANAGIFGPRTEKVLKALQNDLNLPGTGELDAATLAGLDELLMKAAENVTPDSDTGEVESDTVSQPIDVTAGPLEFTLQKEGSKWFATAQGVRFYVGNRVPYEGRIGLMNTRDTSSAAYDPEKYSATFGPWAYFINPTAKAESEGHFNRLNTYDSAGFTFGFLQFAAHVPDGDFVKFFRALLELPEKAAYFPELQLHDGRIVQTTSSGLIRLETADSSDLLKRYLNPSGSDVEQREVLSSARFIHWSASSPAHRETQVKIGIETIRQKLRVAQQKMGVLDGRSDKVCFVVADILHQGRGKYVTMKAIIQNNNDAAAYGKLLQIGAASYPERIQTIRAEVQRLEAAGKLGNRKYQAATNELV
jgi:hypothetical protein